MPDNVVLNAGSGGQTLATDQLSGGEHVQKVKLLDGTADSSAAIPGDATNGLDVDVTRVQGTVTTDPSDRALRDCGKIDVAALDQYSPQDTDTGGGVINALPVVLKAVVSGGGNLGDATTPVRVDPTGATAQPVTGTFWQATQPVSAASLPLPSGAATETTLAGVKTGTDKIPAVGQAAMAASVPVAIANNQSAVPVSGTFWQGTQPVSASSLPLPTGAATETTLAGVKTGTDKIPAVGQAVMASSVPVAIASNQSAVPVSGTITDGGAGKTLKRLAGSTAATASIIAAVGGKRLKVFAFAVQSRNDTMTVQMRDGAAGSMTSLQWSLNTREGVVASAINPPGFLFGTTAGNALDLVVTGTGTIHWEVSYWDDDAS